MIDVLHTVIDVLAGRRNLPGHEADELHEALTPGYTTPVPSAADVAQAQALLARASITESASATTPGAAPEGDTAGS